MQRPSVESGCSVAKVKERKRERERQREDPSCRGWSANPLHRHSTLSPHHLDRSCTVTRTTSTLFLVAGRQDRFDSRLRPYTLDRPNPAFLDHDLFEDLNRSRPAFSTHCFDHPHHRPVNSAQRCFVDSDLKPISCSPNLNGYCAHLTKRKLICSGPLQRRS